MIDTAWLLETYKLIQNKVKQEISFDEYFEIIKHPYKFDLATALSFEIVSRNAEMPDHMLGKYTAAERIGIFAMTHLIEKTITKNKIKLFDLLKYDIRCVFNDNTHETIKGSSGNYAADLKYETSGFSKISFTFEVKSVENITELDLYTNRDTSTGFPYNADFLILFIRPLNKYILVARDIEYFNMNKKMKCKISEEYLRIKSNGKDYIIMEQSFMCPDTFSDVHNIKLNTELENVAEQIADALGIEQKHYTRKNY